MRHISFTSFWEFLFSLYGTWLSYMLKVFANSTLWVILMLVSIFFCLDSCWDFSASLSSWVLVVVQSLSHVRLSATLWTACSTPGSYLFHYLPEFSQIHIHWNYLLHSVYFKYYTVKFCIPLQCCQKCWFVLFWQCIHLVVFRLQILPCLLRAVVSNSV